MKLPSDSDYQAAIQNPRQAFSDPELQDARPELMETGALAGMPRPRAGNFATVYKLSRGERSWAVRCFTRAVQPDQQARYQELIRHLSSHRLPCTVDVSFLSQGIQVQGRWFPIVKMEWVQGESLGRYVEQHRGSPRALFDLAAAWVELQGDLGRARVAHGDLQHGNVVIAPEGLRLVDYDGMFVPALARRPSHERGHAHYQHPDRDGGVLHERLDHFSAWVVFLSLVALAHEPGLWERFQGGDDCLLFRRKDFVERERSPLFQALLGSRHARVKALTTFFLESVLSCRPADVPPLAGAPLSLIGHARGVAPEGLLPPSAAREVAGLMCPESGAPVELSSVPLPDRQMANGFLLAGGLSAVLSAAMSPAWLVGLGLTGGLGWVWARASFQRQEFVARPRRLQQELAEAAKELAHAETRLRQLLSERARLGRKHQAHCAGLLSSMDALSRRRERLLDEARQAHEAAIRRFVERHEDLDAQEHQERDALSAELASQTEASSHRGSALAASFAARHAALRVEEAALEEAFRNEGPAGAAELERELEALSRELSTRTGDVAALAELDAQLAAARRHCADLHWAREARERELAGLATPRFSRYLSLLIKDTQGPS